MPSSRSTFEVPAALISDPKVPPLAKALYLSIRHCGPCSIQELSAASGIGRESVRHLLASLAAEGWASVRGGGNRRKILAARPDRVQQVMAWRLAENRPYMLYAGESLTKLLLNETVDDDDFVDNARAWFLQNPGTSQFLEYDRYYKKAHVAFEFNGPQHVQTTERFNDEGKVTETRARDELKAELSQNRGIVLVTVFEDDLTLEGICAKIPRELPKAHVDPTDGYVRALLDLCGEYIANCKRFRARDRNRRSDEPNQED